MRIMYVEDNAVNLALIQRIAQMNKHDLVSYDEAEKALDALQKGETVDLILLDIQLAGEMDGITFAKTVRLRGWQQPIIAITAYAMMGDKERILAAGCNEYLPKPLPIAEFLALLAKYDPMLSAPVTAASSSATSATASASSATQPVRVPTIPPTPSPTPPPTTKPADETPTQPVRDVPLSVEPVSVPAIQSPTPNGGSPQPPPSTPANEVKKSP
jgi:CheY-like chemotaxis protein